MTELDIDEANAIAPIAAEGALEAAAAGSDLTRGLGRNVAWTYVSVVAVAIGNLVIAGLSVRRLGTTEFGYVAALTTLSGLFSIIDFGLSASVIHATARLDAATSEQQRDTIRRDVHAAHATYVLLGGAVVAVTAVVCAVLALTWSSHDVSTTDMVTATFLFGLNAAVYLGTSAWLGMATGHRQFRQIAIASTIGVVVELVVVAMSLDALGIVAVALAQVVGLALTRGLIASLARHASPWFVAKPVRVSWASVRAVYGFALPLVVMAASAQIVAATDVIVVGAVATAAAVGLYKLGNTLPTSVVNMLYRGYDVAFPNLAGSDDRALQLDATAFLTRIFAFASGVGFTAMVFLREPIIRLIAGDVDHLAASALAVFALMWLLNTPVHGLALLLIARREHGVMAWLVGGEAIANVACTIPMAIWWGPLGAAWATLATLAVSNLVVLPLLARRVGEDGAMSLVWRDGIGSAATGAAVACVAAIPSLYISADLAEVVVVGLVAVVLGVAVGGVALGTTGRQRLRLLTVRTA